MAWAVERDLSGRLVGMARAVGDGTYLLIVNVVVDPAHQAHGLGRRLIDSLRRDPPWRPPSTPPSASAPEVAAFYGGMRGVEAQAGTSFRVGALDT